MTAQSAAETARDALSKRTIPQMRFGSGQHLPRTTPSSTTPSSDIDRNAIARFSVEGKAVVTGGTGTLGLAACYSLLEHGLSGLAIFDMNPEQAAPAIEDLRARFPGRQVIFCKVDVTDEVRVAEAVNEAATALGSVDHLFCFSGIVGCHHALDMTVQQWRRILDVNTTGSFICAQAVARKMVEQGTGGSITLTASISAHRVNYPQPQAGYNVSKAAVLALKNCLAAEWAVYGIRVNSISPGYMDTILNDGDGLASTRDVWTSRNPSGRMGKPSELTGVVVMLASSSSTYLNGADIVVDGGGHVL
jgi:sorbose reductase